MKRNLIILAVLFVMPLGFLATNGATAGDFVGDEAALMLQIDDEATDEPDIEEEESADERVSDEQEGSDEPAAEEEEATDEPPFGSAPSEEALDFVEQWFISLILGAFSFGLPVMASVSTFKTIVLGPAKRGSYGKALGELLKSELAQGLTIYSIAVMLATWVVGTIAVAQVAYNPLAASPFVWLMNIPEPIQYILIGLLVMIGAVFEHEGLSMFLRKRSSGTSLHDGKKSPAALDADVEQRINIPGTLRSANK